MTTVCGIVWILFYNDHIWVCVLRAPLSGEVPVVLLNQSNGVYATAQLEDSGWQNGDKMSGKIHLECTVSRDIFLHSAVLSLPAVQLRKLPNNFS